MCNKSFLSTYVSDGEMCHIWVDIIQNNILDCGRNSIISCHQSTHSLWICPSQISCKIIGIFFLRWPSVDCTEQLSHYCCCLSYYFHQHVLLQDSLHLHIFLLSSVHIQAVLTSEATCSWRLNLQVNQSDKTWVHGFRLCMCYLPLLLKNWWNLLNNVVQGARSEVHSTIRNFWFSKAWQMKASWICIAEQNQVCSFRTKFCCFNFIIFTRSWQELLWSRTLS